MEEDILITHLMSMGFNKDEIEELKQIPEATPLERIDILNEIDNL